MAEGAEPLGKLGAAGHAPLPGSAPVTPEPGKVTHAASPLPRTTSEHGGSPAPQAAAASSVQGYYGMLAAVLAAKDLTDRAKPGDAAAQAQIIQLLALVERRLYELNDHQGRLAQFGAGNIAGQATLDMAEAAIRTWRQRLMLGAIVRTEELVLRFRSGAEVLRFLTGESSDAPTLREFNHVSGVVGVGAAVPVLAPALITLAAEEAVLLAFAARVAAQRVVLWSLSHPAAALAASESLLGLGVQIGEDGWEGFWGQLQDPQGRWFVIAQVLMDFMNVKMGMSSHGDAPRGAKSAGRQVEPNGAKGRAPDVVGARAPDVDAARQQTARARAVVQRIHDGATESGESAHTVDASSPPQRKQLDPARPDTGPKSDRTTVTDALVERGGAGKVEATELLLKEIERNAGGLRRPASDTIEPAEMERLKQEFADLGGDPEMLKFNQGNGTSYSDRNDVIQVRGDVNPIDDSLHPRSAMSSKAALGHELGHARYRGTKLPIGAWNDEFRASYWAAKNLSNLSEQDRIHLVLDAMERAREAGVPISVNAFMKKVLYGY